MRPRLFDRAVEHPVDVDALTATAPFRDAVSALAGRLGRPSEDVAAELTRCFQGLSAEVDPLAVAAWLRIGDSLLRAYDVVADENALEQLRRLDRQHTLVWLPSHRSYLDLWVVARVLTSRGLSAPYGLGGANLNFFPFGTLARRTGTIFIRRSAQDDPVYRFALREYIGQLTRNGRNLLWSIEGGRTRTGKLRPPRFGLLRYLVDAVAATDGPEVNLVPVSLVYDQLHEVSSMTGEALGSQKSPEDVRWLIRLARQQRRRLGHVYLDIGEAIPLRERLGSLTADPAAAEQPVERLALEVSHRINQATPVTLTAVVALALLAADRAVTLDEVLATVAPTARYLQQRQWPVAGGLTLTDPDCIRRTLGELVASGTVTLYDGGTESVWAISPGQHLVAAFYRNTAIHVFVNRAIAELALLAAAADPGLADPRLNAYRVSLALREVLKFDFFFAGRGEFGDEMRTEMALIDPHWEELEPSGGDIGRAARWLEQARPHVAHLVLRPFLDAYLVVADLLAARGTDERVDEQDLLAECLRVGHQLVLQRRLASDESVSLELFGTALRLARHRGLLNPEGPDLALRRRAFADEIRAQIGYLSVIADLPHRAIEETE